MPRATCSPWKMAFALVPLAFKTMNAPKKFYIKELQLVHTFVISHRSTFKLEQVNTNIKLNVSFCFLSTKTQQTYLSIASILVVTYNIQVLGMDILFVLIVITNFTKWTKMLVEVFFLPSCFQRLSNWKAHNVSFSSIFV